MLNKYVSNRKRLNFFFGFLLLHTDSTNDEDKNEEDDGHGDGRNDDWNDILAFSTFGMISVGLVDLVTYCLHWTILHTLLWNFHLVSIQVLEINLPRGNQFREFCHSLLLLPSIQLCGSHKVE